MVSQAGDVVDRESYANQSTPRGINSPVWVVADRVVMAKTIRTRRFDPLLHPSLGSALMMIAMSEGEAQVRASATAYNSHWTKEAQGRRS